MDQAYRIGENIIAGDVRLLYLGQKKKYTYKMFHSNTVLNEANLKTLLVRKKGVKWIVPRFFTKGCGNMDELGFCAGHLMDKGEFINIYCGGVEPPEMPSVEDEIMTAKEKEEKKALDYIISLIKGDPCFPKGYYKAASEFGRFGMYKDALKYLRDAFKQVIQTKRRYAPAYFGLGLVYLHLGKRSSALKQYQRLKNIDERLAKELLDNLKRSTKGKGTQISAPEAQKPSKAEVRINS
ncbi:MAG: tetratricopeptide repeat protein [bacterium]